jgi:hypothetical protein
MNCKKCGGVITEFKEVAGEKYCHCCYKQAQDKEDRKVFQDSMPKVTPKTKEENISVKCSDRMHPIDLDSIIWRSAGESIKLEKKDIWLDMCDIKKIQNQREYPLCKRQELKMLCEDSDCKYFRHCYRAKIKTSISKKMEIPIEEHNFSGLESYMISPENRIVGNNKYEYKDKISNMIHDKTIQIDGIEYYKIGVEVYFIWLDSSALETIIKKGKIANIRLPGNSIEKYIIYEIFDASDSLKKYPHFVSEDNIFKDYESAIREVQRRNKSNG